MSRQTFVVRIDAALARDVKRFLADSTHGYDSLNEFVEVALLNQLNTEKPDQPDGAEHKQQLAAPPPTLGPVPTSGKRIEFERPPTSETPLFVFTNRLGPIKIAMRALASLCTGAEAPALADFQARAASAARVLGESLRGEDQALGRKGMMRRFIAFPIGEDKEAAIQRFIHSFTLAADEKGPTGPLAVLGLANLTADGRVAPTRAGWELAIAPSALLQEAPGLTLSDQEAEILRRQCVAAPGEFAAASEFVELVHRAAGRQSRVDELISSRHSEWSPSLIVAYRSAMAGRLADLRVVEVSGRGTGATIRLMEASSEFQRQGRRGAVS